jgi:hypothetical protein
MSQAWAEGELEVARRLTADPSSCLCRDARPMIVEDQVDRSRKSVSGIEQLENLDAVARATVDQGVNLYSLRKGDRAVGA